MDHTFWHDSATRRMSSEHSPPQPQQDRQKKGGLKICAHMRNAGHVVQLRVGLYSGILLAKMRLIRYYGVVCVCL